MSNLRQAISLFKATKGRFPRDLRELVTEKIVVPHKDTIISAKYLEPYSLDKDMNILDSFDIPFAYDPTTGRVWSAKKGLEEW